MAKTTKATEKVKTECPVTRKQFKEGAKPIPVTVAGRQMTAVKKKDLDGGSLGWFAGDKVAVNDYITLNLNGEEVRAQVSVNITVIGSAEAKAE